MKTETTFVSRSFASVGMLALMSILVCGCVSTSSGSGRVDFHEHDEGVTLPEVRARIPADYLLGGMEGGLLGNLAGNHAIDIFATTFDGRMKEGLNGTEFLIVDGQRLDGPALVAADYDVEYGHLAYSFSWMDQYFTADFQVGLGFIDLEMDYSTPTATARDHVTTVGMHTGFRGGVDLTSRLGATAEIAVTHSGSITVATAAALLVFEPVPQVEIYTGWRWWDIESRRSTNSDIQLDVDGPVVGIAFSF